MAIFPRESGDNKDVETIIGSSVKVEGTFVGSGDVTVEGQVVGNLKTSKDLKVREGAMVKADVEAANLWVAGEIRGHVKCSGKLELTPTAKVFGNVETQTVSVAHGAILHGKLTMSGHEAAPASK